MMGSYVALLQQLFREYNLYHFEQELSFVIWKLRSGNITESEARRFLWHIRPYVEKQQAFFNVLPPPPAANLLFGEGPFDVEFGTTEHKMRIGLRLLREVRHMLVAGAPGTGKTVFLRNLIIKVCRLSKQLGRRIPIVVIDPKRDFVDIAQLAEGEWVYLEAGDDARFSWEKPEGVPLDAWVSGLCQDLAARLGFIAARVGLSKAFHFLIDALNGTDAEPELWPSPRLLLELLEASPWNLWFEKREYYATAKTMLADLVANGSVLDCARGISISRLIASGKNIVVGMNRLKHAGVRAHIFDLIIRHAFESCLHTDHRVDFTEKIVIVEEADEFVSQTNDAVFPFDQSPIGEFLTQVRELGVRAVVSVHLLNQISPFVLANTTDKVIFNQANPESIVEARRTLLLPAGAERMISSLPPGMALVRQGLAKVSEAMLVQIDYVPPHRGAKITHDGYPYVPSRRLQDSPAVLKALAREIAAFKSRQRDQKRFEVEQLSPEARALLYQASLKLYWPVVRLYDTRPSSSLLHRLLKELKEGNYAQFVEARIARKNLLLIELLEAGWKLLGKPPIPLRGRGFLEHRTFANWVRMVGEKRGHKATCEWIVAEQHPVDAMWRVNGGYRVFEVVVDCHANLVASLQSCFTNPEVLLATVVAPQKAQLTELKGIVTASAALAPFLNKVTFESVEAFEKELWP